MTARELATRLGAKRIGKDKWMAKCPAHPDKHPSLSIRVGRKVPVLLKCMSCGCEISAILAALGLKWADVFDDSRRMSRSEIRKMEREQAIREAAEKEKKELIRRAIRLASRWQSEADRLGARMAAFPGEEHIVPLFHRALTKMRLFHKIAGWLESGNPFNSQTDYMLHGIPKLGSPPWGTGVWQ